MNADERDELLRWVAADVLGWEQGIATKAATGAERRCWWDALVGTVRYDADLLGWPGFGLAMETVVPENGTWVWSEVGVNISAHIRKGMPIDPGLEAWRVIHHYRDREGIAEWFVNRKVLLSNDR